MCILELSKSLMYEFHYDYFKINMVTSQDSLMCDVYEDVYESFSTNKEMFDFSK